MTDYNSSSKGAVVKINIVNLLLVISLAVMIPVVNGYLGFTKSAHVLIIFICFYLVGLLPLSFTALRFINNSLFIAISILIGSFIVFISKLFIPISIGILIFLFHKKKLNFAKGGISLESFALFLPGIILLFLTDTKQTFSNEAFSLVGGLPDQYFFTAIVASIKKYNSIFNSAFAYGTPISSQSMSFIPPAILANMSQLTAHISLWGIWVPFYKIFGIAFLSYSINFYTGTQKNFLYLFLTGMMILFLAPLNPKSFLDVCTGYFIWNGHSYIVPGGNPPFMLGFFWVGMILFLLFYLEKCEYNKCGLESILFILLLSSLIVVKVALFPIVFLFCVFVGSKWILIGSKRVILIYLITFLAALFWYKLFFGFANGLVTITLDVGYYLEKLIVDYKLVNFALPLPIAIALLLILFFGIRLMFILVGLKGKNRRLMISLLVSFLFVFVFVNLIRLNIYNAQGKLIQDLSFDLVQFIRGSFILITSISIIPFISIVSAKKSRIKNLLKVSLVLWSIPIIISVITKLKESNSYRKVTNEWLADMGKEINEDNTNVLAMISDPMHPGQLLSARELGTWWTNCMRADGTGYVITREHLRRSEMLENLLNKDSTEDQILIIELLKKEGVDCLVATPNNITYFEELAAKGLVFRRNNSNWMFDLMDRS